MSSCDRERGSVWSALAFLVVLIGVFVAAITFWLWPHFNPEQQRMTDSVPGEVTEAEPTRGYGLSSRQDYVVHYRYEFDGSTYEADALSIDGEWRRNAPLSICVDPEEPADHVPMFETGRSCGDAKTGNPTRVGTKIG